MNRLLNTASNAAYFIAAFAVDDLYLSGCLVVLALGSGWYHWSREKWSQRADHLGMFLVVSALALSAVPIWAYVLVTTVCAVLAFRGVQSATEIVALVGALAVATQPELWRAAVGLVLFGWAYYLWGREAHADWWAEKGMAYHSLWHLLTAIAFIVLA